MDHVEALAEEGLAYFERAGDAGDRKYVDAIRSLIAELRRGITALSAKPEGEAVAWIRAHRSHTDFGIEYDEEVVAGSDCPPGEGWAPLYTRPPRSHGVVVDEAMIDAYLSAQAKAVQAVDAKWGGGGKAASYLHPVREACRAGLQAALVAALGEGEK